MKTYEEMAQNALNRISNYETVQRKRKKNVAKIATPAVSFCLVVVLSIGAWQLGLFKTEAPNNANEVLQQDNLVLGKSDDVIIVNKLSFNPTADRMNIALLIDDFVKMDKKELNDYYGTNVFPIVPDDLKNWDEADDFAGYGIYRRDKGAGDVYCDTVVLNYSNADFSRNLNIEVAKGVIPSQDFVVLTTDYQKSIIAEQEVIIGLDTVQNIYFVGLMHNDVGFAITAAGFTQDEVVAVIRSIVE